jgi:hypothetical protein
MNTFTTFRIPDNDGIDSKLVLTQNAEARTATL